MIHALEATTRPTLSLLPPMLCKLKKKFTAYSNIVYNFTGKKVVIPFDKIHLVVKDCRSVFLKELDERFDEKIHHEEDILTATASDPRYCIACVALSCFIVLPCSTYLPATD